MEYFLDSFPPPPPHPPPHKKKKSTLHLRTKTNQQHFQALLHPAGNLFTFPPLLLLHEPTPWGDRAVLQRPPPQVSTRQGRGILNAPRSLRSPQPGRAEETPPVGRGGLNLKEAQIMSKTLFRLNHVSSGANHNADSPPCM